MPKGVYKRKSVKKVKKAKTTITIPVKLARLLTADKTTVKKGFNPKDVQDLGKALLGVMLKLK